MTGERFSSAVRRSLTAGLLERHAHQDGSGDVSVELTTAGWAEVSS